MTGIAVVVALGAGTGLVVLVGLIAITVAAFGSDDDRHDIFDHEDGTS